MGKILRLLYTNYWRELLITLISVLAVCFISGVLLYIQHLRHSEQVTKLEHSFIAEKHQQAIEYQKEIERLNGELHTKNEQILTETRNQNETLYKSSEDLLNAIRNGTFRLYDKHATAGTAQTSAKGSSTSTGQSGNGGCQSGELSSKTSENLIRLATDAEKTNIGLKTCIKQYNNLKAICSN